MIMVHIIFQAHIDPVWMWGWSTGPHTSPGPNPWLWWALSSLLKNPRLAPGPSVTRVPGAFCVGRGGPTLLLQRAVRHKSAFQSSVRVASASRAGSKRTSASSGPSCAAVNIHVLPSCSRQVPHSRADSWMCPCRVSSG